MIHKNFRKPSTAILMVGAVASVLYACVTPLTPEDVKLRASEFVPSGSTAISATVASTLTNQPVVIVRDQYDEPLAGVPVTFTASAGAQPTGATKTTDANGQASPTSWTLPQQAGSVTLTAAVPGTSLPSQTFTVTLTPGPAAQAGIATTTPSSNNQSATAGSAVAVAPQVLVADQYGNPVTGVSVTFAVTAGGGTVVPTTPVQTGVNGIARPTSWTLGTALGANTLRATVAGITAPVTFTATATAGPPASMVVAPGTPSSQGQSAIAGTKVAVAPAVLVRDANNNPVSGVTARFTIGGGNGKLLNSSTDNVGQNSVDVVTNASGIATVAGWKLGDVGSNTMSVNIPSASSVAAVVFSATGTVGPPVNIDPLNEAWDYTRYSTVHGGSPSVVVKDEGGNPVSGVTVTWTSGNANSTVTGTATSVTSPSGVAAFPKASNPWTAGTTVGQQMQLVATVQSVTPALTETFTSLIVGDPTQIEISAGDDQSAGVNSEVPVDPASLVKDAGGNPVPGVSVTYTVLTGGGSVTGSPVLTDSVGVARVGSWRLGTTVGTDNNTLRAQITSAVPQVTFTASATAGAPASISARSDNPTSGPVNSVITVRVIVRDGLNNPISGTNVTFAVIGAPTNAAITSTATVPTNTLGEATATWRLDTLARTNQITARVGTTLTATLSATGVALAASKLTIVQGNNQTVPPGSTVPTQPRVRVSDQYNNPVGSQGVTFATAANSGTVSTTTCAAAASCTTTSATSTGLASANWTLGGTAGTQTMSAFLTATPSATVTFTATAAASNTCTTNSYTIGTTVNGSIASTDCGEGTPATYYDKYQFTGASQQFFAMVMKPTGFAGELARFFWPATGNWIFGTAAAGDSTTSYNIVSAGTYSMNAGASVAGATGTYSLRTTLNPTTPSDWCAFDVTRGITHSHNLSASASNCLYKSTVDETATFRSSRVYRILLSAGESISITMSGTLDNYIEVYDITTGTASFVTFRDAEFANDSPEVLTLTNTNSSTRWYAIRATHYLSSSADTPKTGNYSMTINP